MKKFAKIISMICVLTFVLSLSAFAAIDSEKEIEYALKADKASYNVDDVVTITLYSDDYTGTETFGLVYLYTEYDADGLEFVSESTGSVTEDPAGALNIEYEEGDYIADWSSVFTFKFKALKAGDYTFGFTSEPTLADLDYNGTPTATVPSITITVKEAAPETPVSVSTTMTVNEKEYTDVPNAVVSGTIENGAFNGSIVVDYWKDGVKALAPKVFSSFANMPTFSGSGSATFSVAIMGVPSNVTITSITVQ